MKLGRLRHWENVSVYAIEQLVELEQIQGLSAAASEDRGDPRLPSPRPNPADFRTAAIR